MATKPRKHTHCVVCGALLPYRKGQYCSTACSDTIHKRKVAKPEQRFSSEAKAAAYAGVRGKSRSTPETPMPPLPEIMATLAQFARDPQPEPVPVDAKRLHSDVGANSLHDARVKADTLIRRRGGTLPRSGYIRPEKYEVNAEQTS